MYTPTFLPARFGDELAIVARTRTTTEKRMSPLNSAGQRGLESIVIEGVGTGITGEEVEAAVCIGNLRMFLPMLP